MKTISSIHNSCLYPHLSLTTFNPHAHEDTRSRAGVGGYSIFRIFASERHDYPLPPAWAYSRGYTRPPCGFFSPLFLCRFCSLSLQVCGFQCVACSYLCMFLVRECVPLWHRVCCVGKNEFWKFSPIFGGVKRDSASGRIKSDKFAFDSVVNSYGD